MDTPSQFSPDSLRTFQLEEKRPSLAFRIRRSMLSRKLTQRFWPTLRIMQLLSLFPSNMSFANSRSPVQFVITMVWILYSLLTFSLNAFLLRLNFYTTVEYINMFGILHTFAVSSLITGLKPLINVLAIAVFGFNIIRHKRLLKLMNIVDGAFKYHFDSSPNIELYNAVVVIIILVIFTSTFTLRLLDHFATGATFGESILYDVGIVIVPMLSIWNIFPLLYYVILNRIVCHWLNILRNEIAAELENRKRELNFYYTLFHHITTVQKTIGQVVNPFVFFSMGWSQFCLCLTIYFITQGTEAINDPPGILESDEDMEIWFTLVKFIAIWSSLQVILSFAYVGLICYTGTKTNEMTRQVIDAILTPAGSPLDSWDRYQILCFVVKMRSQETWGMSIWRLFPLERDNFFKLFGAIVTYSFLLLTLKKQVPSDNSGKQ